MGAFAALTENKLALTKKDHILENSNSASHRCQGWPTSSVAYMMLYSRGPVAHENFGNSRCNPGVLSEVDLGPDPGTTSQTRTCYLHHC